MTINHADDSLSFKVFNDPIHGYFIRACFPSKLILLADTLKFIRFVLPSWTPRNFSDCEIWSSLAVATWYFPRRATTASSILWECVTCLRFLWSFSERDSRNLALPTLMHFASQSLDSVMISVPCCFQTMRFKFSSCVVATLKIFPFFFGLYWLFALSPLAGHGPFSHMFDRAFIKQIHPTSSWEHENASVELLDLLIEENHLWPIFQKYGMQQQDLTFVKEIILGCSLEHIGSSEPAAVKRLFLF